jgi:putative MFS transporter
MPELVKKTLRRCQKTHFGIPAGFRNSVEPLQNDNSILTVSSPKENCKPILKFMAGLTLHRGAKAAIIVAALGYFVDIYDLVLFNIVRIPSLKSLGFSGTALTDTGLTLLNIQMAGMLVGGILWGILGDKKGRLSVLFGSIFLYSAANIANGFVTTIDQYMILRFIAGIGLAGELGAGITLVVELLPKEKRGYGTMIVASFGVTGAIAAGLIANSFDWHTSYFVGGGLGLTLLFLRIGAFESGLFGDLKKLEVRRGHFFSLFNDKTRFLKYLRCIATGLPTWYMVGILMGLSPEITKALGVQGNVSVANAILFFYAGLSVGDLSSGAISQRLQSRKKVMMGFLIGCATMITIYFLLFNATNTTFYVVCFFMGTASGYWAIFVTVAAEQFGTNLRATVATTVPNFVRGATVPITLLFQFLRAQLFPLVGQVSILYSGAIVGALCLSLAIYAAAGQLETFGKDLNYVEEI